MVTFEDFKKLDLVVGKIKAVEDVDGADSLYKVIVDIGDEKRQVLAGLKDFYEKDELNGKKVVMISNLEPKEMFGEKSEGMLLAAGKDAKLLTVDKDVENGSRVS